MSHVIDLDTMTEYWYSLPPEKAVVCAFNMYKLKRGNTWEYDFSKAVYSPSGKTVSAGNFCALTKGAKP